MKVLLVSYGGATSTDAPLLLLKAVKEDGCYGDIFIISDEYFKSLSLRLLQILGIDIHSPKLRLKIVGKKILKMAKRIKPDLVLLSGSNFYLLPRDMGKLKKITDCELALWEHNNFFWRGFQSEAIKYYNYIFMIDSYMIPVLQGPAGNKNVFYLPALADPDEHKILQLSKRDKARYGADVSFIGTPTPHRIEYFKPIKNIKFKLWGFRTGWDRVTSLNQFYQDEPVFDLKKTKIYNASKITLSLKKDNSQINAVNPRVFEILSCGGFPLIEYTKDLDTLFNVGREVIAFKGIEDMIAKINYYLSHPEERNEIIERGRKKVVSEYTYKVTAKKILRIIKEKQLQP